MTTDSNKTPANHIHKTFGFTFRVFAANLPYNLALEQLDKKLKEATPEKLHDREGLQKALEKWTALLDGMHELRIGDSADEMARMLQLDDTKTYRALKAVGEVKLDAIDKENLERTLPQLWLAWHPNGEQLVKDLK